MLLLLWGAFTAPAPPRVLVAEPGRAAAGCCSGPTGVRRPARDSGVGRGAWFLRCRCVLEGVRTAQGCTALKKNERSSYFGDGGRNSSPSSSSSAGLAASCALHAHTLYYSAGAHHVIQAIEAANDVECYDSVCERLLRIEQISNSRLHLGGA